MEVKYKPKDLKVYCTKEWLAESKKKYRQVFDRMETTHIYFEFSFYNKLFDEEDWNAKVTLKAFNITQLNNPVLLCNLDYERKISKEDNIFFVREGWGNPEPGNYWAKGTYKWEAYIDGALVLSKQFYVEDFGKVTETTNPYFNVKSIKLFEGPNELPPLDERKYYQTFSSQETRYLWVELTIEDLHPNVSWYGEFFFNFFDDAKQLRGQATEVVNMYTKKNNPIQIISSGWGSDTKGTWYKDNYTVEIVFMDTLIATVPFVVGETFKEGMVSVTVSPNKIETQTDIPSTPVSPDEILKEIDEMIGLDSIKQRMRDYTTYLNFLKLRQEKGLQESSKIMLHSVFTGNPGTGKTTVALLLGKIFKNMGLLSKDTVHEVDRADLIGKYIGQTAPQVREHIEKARGGILFIDEAYALARGGEDDKDYGREAIEVLIKEMSDGPGDIAIIFAGYPKEMEVFINSNPGLKSRVNMYFDFPDYTPDELMQIAEFSANKKSLIISPEAKELFIKKLTDAYRNRDRMFGNARYAISLLEESKINLALRVMTSKDPNKLSQEELSTIILDDIEKVFKSKEKKYVDIPVDEDLLRETTTDLNKLIGMANVKTEINELIKLVRFYKESKKDVLNSLSLHHVFTGNPGTGKTTIARIMAKLFKALGLLERGHIVECDRESLVAGYVGQTAIKTQEKINQAMGGVLFIDEAYALSPRGDSSNDFGPEAIEVILKEMEDNRGKFAVIVAGYTEEMREFLLTNPGLSSRFDKTIHFNDYSEEELIQIAIFMFGTFNLVLDKKAKEHLQKYFNFRCDNRDKFFGNARVVRKIVQEAVKNQNLRMASIPTSERTDRVLKTVTIDDVQEFQPSSEELLTKKQRQIGFELNEPITNYNN
ncbi:MAG: AAA family ATPase [Ignavibacteriales bacterium]|nr:AAA family ATPase [Ignavibacteriales bacterium]